MCRNFWNQSSLSFVLVVALSSPAGAQEMERPGGPKPMPPVMEELDRMTAPERGGKDVEERIRQFETQRREKLLQALQLDEATHSRLNQRLEQLDRKGEDLRRQRKEAIQALREQAKGLRNEMRRGPRNGGGRGQEEALPPSAGGRPADNGALKQALERVYAVEDSMAGLRRERLQVARELLTPEQQAKYLLFTAKFRKEMRERLQREYGGQEGGPPDRRRR
jgi:hypothetical protein